MDIKGESLGFNWSESVAREEGIQKPAFNLVDVTCISGSPLTNRKHL